jgi:hypothetical protein
MTEHKVGTREEWLAARAELLERVERLQASRRRKGWTFPRVSSTSTSTSTSRTRMRSSGRSWKASRSGRQAGSRVRDRPELRSEPERTVSDQ